MRRRTEKKGEKWGRRGCLFCLFVCFFVQTVKVKWLFCGRRSGLAARQQRLLSGVVLPRQRAPPQQQRPPRPPPRPRQSSPGAGSLAVVLMTIIRPLLVSPVGRGTVAASLAAEQGTRPPNVARLSSSVFGDDACSRSSRCIVQCHTCNRPNRHRTSRHWRTPRVVSSAASHRLGRILRRRRLGRETGNLVSFFGCCNDCIYVLLFPALPLDPSSLFPLCLSTHWWIIQCLQYRKQIIKPVDLWTYEYSRTNTKEKKNKQTNQVVNK